MPFRQATPLRLSTRPVFALALAACASLAAPAAARGPDSAGTGDEREAQRTELYREATKAARAGQWAEAKERLRAALAIRSSPKVLFSLAQAEEQLGQLASAQADYARALEGAATDGKGDVVQAAEQAQRALAPRVPHVRVVLTGGTAPSGASATLDDRPAPVGAAVAVDPGAHRLIVIAPGMRSAAVNVRVIEGQQLEVPVALESEAVAPVVAAPASSAPSSPSISAQPSLADDVDPKESPASSPLRTVGIVTAGAGVVAVAVGVAFGVESMSKHHDAANACPDATCPTAAGASLWHDAVTSGRTATLAFVLGGVAIVGGAVLWLTAPKSTGAGTQVGLGPGSVLLRGAW
jgi:hypothetical protein